MFTRRITDSQALRYVVILTACIDPSAGRIKVYRSDPADRLGDYQQALRFWLKLNDDRLNRLVFIENSGYSLESLHSIAARENPFQKQVEFISVDANFYPEDVHYGYAELDMVDRAFRTAQLIQPGDIIIKVTGRLQFPKIVRLLNRLPTDLQFSVDCRNNAFMASQPKIFVATQLMIFAHSFYQQHLLDIKLQLSRKNPTIEYLLYQKLTAFQGQSGVILRWPINVDPVGYAAHWNKKYNDPKRKLISLFRAVCRRVCPNWWI